MGQTRNVEAVSHRPASGAEAISTIGLVDEMMPGEMQCTRPQTVEKHAVPSLDTLSIGTASSRGSC